MNLKRILKTRDIFRERTRIATPSFETMFSSGMKPLPPPHHPRTTPTQASSLHPFSPPTPKLPFLFPPSSCLSPTPPPFSSRSLPPLINRLCLLPPLPTPHFNPSPITGFVARPRSVYLNADLKRALGTKSCILIL
jgi:hypothetical protein